MEVTLGGWEPVTLIAIGLAAGLSGGLLGIGGSLVIIPALTELLGHDQHLYQSAAMIVNFFVAIPAVNQHRRVGAVEPATVRRIIPIGVSAVVVGVLVSESSLFAGRYEIYLCGLFGLFLFCVSGLEFRGVPRRNNAPAPALNETPDKPKKDSRMSWRAAAAVAVPTGFVAGLLGVGGGMLAVPLQRHFLNIPLRTAIANSSAIIIATSLVGAVVKNHNYLIEHDHSLRSFALAAMLIPSAMLGSMVGSRLTHRLPIRHLKTVFLLFLLLAAMHLTYLAACSVLTGG